jgi:hypothetical protein
LDVKWDHWTPDTEPSEEELREVYIGWPDSGGVLVLESDESFMTCDVGMLRIVTTMQERCQLLRDRLKAVYFEDSRTYSGLDALGPGKIESKDEQQAKEEE